MLQEFASHGFEQIVARQLRQLGVGHGQIADDGQGAGHQEHPKQDQRQLRTVEFGLRLFGYQVISRAHEAKQQPDDQQVGVHHARLVERNVGKRQVANDVLQAERDAKQNLRGKQRQRGDKVVLGDRLRCVFEGECLHVSFLDRSDGWGPISLRCLVASFAY